MVAFGGMGVRAARIAAGQAAGSLRGCFVCVFAVTFLVPEMGLNWAAPLPGCRSALSLHRADSCAGGVLPVCAAWALGAAHMLDLAWQR